MNTKRILISVVVLSLSTVIIAAKYGDPPCFDPSGSWVGSRVDNNSGELLGPWFLVNYIPLDQDGKKWALDADGFIGDISGTFQDLLDMVYGEDVAVADSYTNSIGVIEKIDRNTFHGSAILYVLDANKNVLLYMYVVITEYFIDCDTIHGVVTVPIFLPGQDGNQDGVPDPGQTPITCLDVQWHKVRVLTPPVCP